MNMNAKKFKITKRKNVPMPELMMQTDLRRAMLSIRTVRTVRTLVKPTHFDFFEMVFHPPGLDEINSRETVSPHKVS